MTDKENKQEPTRLISSALFGVAVGDALGVPVEFYNRERLRHFPVTEMIGFGTIISHPVPGLMIVL